MSIVSALDGMVVSSVQLNGHSTVAFDWKTFVIIQSQEVRTGIYQAAGDGSFSIGNTSTLTSNVVVLSFNLSDVGQMVLAVALGSSSHRKEEEEEEEDFVDEADEQAQGPSMLILVDLKKMQVMGEPHEVDGSFRFLKAEPYSESMNIWVFA